MTDDRHDPLAHAQSGPDTDLAVNELLAAIQADPKLAPLLAGAAGAAPAESDDAEPDSGRPPQVVVQPCHGETHRQAIERMGVEPLMDAFLTVDALQVAQKRPGRARSQKALADRLEALSAAPVAGEDVLLAQAVVLDKVFEHYTHLAIGEKRLEAIEPLLRMALRAQAQCRSTLQTVSDLRHPRAPYVQHVGEQYNAGGHQQINHRTPAHTGLAENRPTELIEDHPDDEIRMDTRAPSRSRRARQASPAVGALHRPEDGGGQGRVLDEPLPGRGAADAPGDGAGAARAAADARQRSAAVTGDAAHVEAIPTGDTHGSPTHPSAAASGRHPDRDRSR